MLFTKEKDAWQKTPNVSYSIGVDAIVMGDTAIFITGITSNVIELIQGIRDKTPVSFVLGRNIRVCQKGIQNCDQLKKDKTNRGRQYNAKKDIEIDQPLNAVGELCDSEW